jgi:predicted enzyme related to lactoylglutathione lyase
MEICFGRIVILVNDYEEAFEFYQRVLFCKKFFDIEMEGQRFLHVGFNANEKSGIWFLEAETEEQRKLVGNQTLNQPTFVIYINSLEEYYDHLKQHNVDIKKEPMEFSGHKFLHFLDLYGNEIVAVEMMTEVNT